MRIVLGEPLLIADEFDDRTTSELAGIMIDLSKLLIARVRVFKSNLLGMQLLHCFGINMRAHRKLTR